MSRSVIAELPGIGGRLPSGASVAPMQCESGGIAGGFAVVRTSSVSASRSPYEASTRMRSTSAPLSSYWKSEACPVERVRPVRTTWVRMTAGPGTDGVR